MDIHFPENQRLNKIITRINVKMSLSCTPSMNNIISARNSKIINSSNPHIHELKCNCISNCILRCQFRKEYVLFKKSLPLVITPNNEYIGNTPCGM